MKRVIQILLFSLLVFQTFNCKKNNNDPPEGTTVKTTIIGQIVDESGAPMAGVQVSTGNFDKVTNAYGEFVFEDITVSKDRFYVKAEKSDYMSAGIGGIATEGSVKYVKIKMLKIGVAKTLPVMSGATISVENDAKIVFPAMAISYKNGGVFTGNAKVYARHLSPSASDFASVIPGGDLVAETGNTLSALYSYGMLGVIIQDEAGNELRIADGMQAEIRMPISADQLSTAPATIPLLTFDEEKGLWIEEGTATKLGDMYVGNVGHFSWWNCDLIYDPPTTISGRVIDCTGAPAAGVTVRFNNQYSLITDNNGYYNNFVPTGLQVTISVTAANNNNIYSTSQPVVINTVLGGNMVPDIVLSCPATISGNLVDCNGQPTFAYVRVVYPSGFSTLFQSSNGSFEVPVQMFSTFSLIIFNSQSVIDTTLSSAGVGSNLNVGTFTLCGNSSGACSDGTTTTTDIDGNVYDVVSIGNQCWLSENLKTSHYRNGDPIISGLSDSEWSSTNIGAYSFYNNDTSYNSQYGKLYNWFAISDDRNIAPVGWHVATDADWDQLLNYLGGGAVAGGKLKAVGTIQSSTGIWEAPNTAADNSSGFYGLPAGYKSYDGSFSGLGTNGYWFTSTSSSSTNAWFYLVNNIASNAYRNDNDKRIGLSVRCVRD